MSGESFAAPLVFTCRDGGPRRWGRLTRHGVTVPVIAYSAGDDAEPPTDDDLWGHESMCRLPPLRRSWFLRVWATPNGSLLYKAPLAPDPVRYRHRKVDGVNVVRLVAPTAWAVSLNDNTEPAVVVDEEAMLRKRPDSAYELDRWEALLDIEMGREASR
jgi:hypothetical protein